MRHTVPVPDDERRPSRRTLRLSTKVALYFALTGLVASLALAVVTYAVSRSFLLDQRLQVARTQTYANAKTVRDQILVGQQPDPARDLRTEGGGFEVILRDDRQFGFPDHPIDSFPLELRTLVAQGGSGQQRFELEGEPYGGVGIALPAADAQH